MSDEQKEPRPDCWPFDPNPPKPAKSDNGFIRCHVCEQVQPVAGHECRAVAEALDDWGPGEVENSLREQAEAAVRRAEAAVLLQSQAEQIASLRDENSALRQAVEELKAGNVATLPMATSDVDSSRGGGL